MEESSDSKRPCLRYEQSKAGSAYRSYLKCGFKEEGRLRKRHYVNGSYVDTIIMGLLKNEFESLLL